jgi:predicted Rossmann-fold nucleotide-binding protein
MEPFDLSHFDLVTPDGIITELKSISEKEKEAVVFIQNISPRFVGFSIDPNRVFFNVKSTLAQIGLDGIGTEYEISKKSLSAQVKVKLKGIGTLGEELLGFIEKGAIIGKLFAADDRRRVRDPFYLSRMFGRSDRWGRPLLSLGGLHGSTDLILDKVDGRCVAYLSLQKGKVTYDSSIAGFLPTLAKALINNYPTRELLKLHQIWQPHEPHNISEDELLLVKTLPLHVRTVWGRVVDELLAEGYHHTTASILEPNTQASGDIYELYGKSKRELTDIPLEFYTLEPYREYVFFEDRDQLKDALQNKEILFKAFQTAPKNDETRSAIYIVKGEQLHKIKESDWTVRDTRMHEFPGLEHSARQALMLERYIEEQPSYPYLKGMYDETITSQGILLSQYFPSPLMKRMLLGDQVQRMLKGIYFQYPSQAHESYFSAEDRALLHDLYKFAIPTYWVDPQSKNILKYLEKPDRDTGLFVPLDKTDTFLKATLFGIYGSNLVQGQFEQSLRELLEGVLKMQNELNHVLLGPKIPIAMVTGGGPGAMEVGNKIATELGILSCANIVDFRHPDMEYVPEQKQNPYVQAKMAYRLDKLVERQAEFNLDFPIFLTGGIGTDFEYTLEEVRRKVGAVRPTPILLLGTDAYWQQKISERYRSNLEHGTIRGSEWISNCFYCVDDPKRGIEIYRKFFTNTLPIGKEGPSYQEGFVLSTKTL